MKVTWDILEGGNDAFFSALEGRGWGRVGWGARMGSVLPTLFWLRLIGQF